MTPECLWNNDSHRPTIHRLLQSPQSPRPAGLQATATTLLGTNEQHLSGRGRWGDTSPGQSARTAPANGWRAGQLNPRLMVVRPRNTRVGPAHKPILSPRNPRRHAGGEAIKSVDPAPSRDEIILPPMLPKLTPGKTGRLPPPHRLKPRVTD